MNTPSPAQIAYRDILISINDWQREAKARNIAFYEEAIFQGEVTVAPGKERTTRKSNCDVCHMPQKPGIRRFWYQENLGWQCFSFHLCDQCWSELIMSQTQAEMVDSLPTTQTT